MSSISSGFLPITNGFRYSIDRGRDSQRAFAVRGTADPVQPRLAGNTLTMTR